MSHVRIVMTGHGRGEVCIDGQPLKDVQSIQFDSDARHCVNEVVLTIVPETVEIEGPARIVTRLHDAGWLLRQAHNELDYHYSAELRRLICEFLNETVNVHGQLESQACPIGGCERTDPHIHAEMPPAFPPNEPARGP